MRTPGKTSYSIREKLLETDGTTLDRAIRTSDRLPILLKTLDPKLANPFRHARLKRDYEISKSLHSPCVLRALTQDIYGGMPAVVFEDFDGVPLSRLLGKPMGIDDFLVYATAIAQAVADLHQLNVIHSNLKPENILINPRTKDLKIAAFGLASDISAEQQSISPPSPFAQIQGSPPYLSPERTGRMNRVVDSRSDLYSLGVTFFEMLTGILPFDAHDTQEWIHAHLARMPPSPTSISPGVPDLLSKMILKLLSKLPEDRYQTARGLQWDLERSFSELKKTGHIQAFTLAERDVSDRLQIAHGLYGRQKEVSELLAGFRRVSERGASELILIAGYSGIGKTSLVRAVEKPVLEKETFFLSGKIELLKRDAPYSPFIQAFRGLILEILTQNEDAIARWRSRIAEALRAHGQLILNVIPEVEVLIGPQPAVPELPPVEAQNRFQSVFRQFIGVFTDKERPLVLFLDDLQWADSASLGLLKDLVTHPEMKSLFIIGAYRDNEVSPSHPLLLTVGDARNQGARISSISLRALSETDLRAWIGEALIRRHQDLAALVSMIHEKTGGNPFFVIQFLTTLREKGLLQFDYATTTWVWDLEKIRAAAFTDNVVEFMLERLKRMPTDTIDALKQLACLGNSADIATMTLINGQTEQEINVKLRYATRASLVARTDGSYKFLHDKIQEAAYSLVPEDKRAHVHLNIGRTLFSRLNEESIADRVFEIVGQLNRGTKLITDTGEKDSLRQLNLSAGAKAKASIAYSAARAYFSQAKNLLPRDAWSRLYDETFTLFLELSECEYLVGNFQRTDELTDLLLKNARANPDRAKIGILRMRLYQVSGRYDYAVKALIEGLQFFGVNIPDSEAEILAATEAESQLLSTQLQGRRISDLIHAPVATDPNQRALINLIGEGLPCAYVGSPNIFPLLAFKSVNCSLQFGNTELSCGGYTAYAIVMVATFGDISSAVQFSELSLRLNEKFNDAKLRGTLLYIHANHIHSWKRHMASAIPLMEQAFLASLDVGDLVYAGFNAYNVTWLYVENGAPLLEVERTARKYESFALQSRNDVVYQALRLFERFAACLQGATQVPGSFDGDDFSESQCLNLFAQANQGSAIAYFHIAKQVALFIYGRYEDALESATAAAAVKREMAGALGYSTHHFYLALTLTALYSDAPEATQKEFARSLEEILPKLKFWADHCPENHLNRYALVAAEVARINDREKEAMHLYEQAIHSARANGFIQNEAIAYEVAARFYLTKGFKGFADTYFREARNCYLRWGAHGKVKLLDRLYPQLVATQGSVLSAVSVSETQLDLLSVIKASQYISGEILLENLVSKLIEIALQQSGAQKGFLILSHDSALTLEATATTNAEGTAVERLQSVPLDSSSLLPLSVIHYVQRTQESVILNDAATDPRQFSGDPYFARAGARSVLALPILRQKKLIGLLYLENNAIPHVFSRGRLAALELLASQAAISLQNAQLYRARERLLAQEKEARQEAQKSVHVRDDFISIASHELRTPLTPLKLQVDLLQRILKSESVPFAPERARIFRETLQNSSRDLDRMIQFIEDVLDASRINAGSLILHPKRTDLSDLVKKVLDRLGDEFRNFGCPRVVNLRRAVGDWDPERIEQVVTKLILNALKFGRGKPVEISTSQNDGTARISVRDHGVGISKEDQTRLFKRYERIAKIKRYGGFGVGLYIAQSVVAAHGGRIIVESDSGRGATFTVELPVEKPTA